VRGKVGISATPDLSFPVSVATLARVVFKHPLNGELMLAKEISIYKAAKRSIQFPINESTLLKK